MTILDTFYLLFKTDVNQGAKADVSALDKQIADLAKKGKERSDAEKKQLLDLRKQRQEMTRDLKDQRNEIDKIGDSYTRLIEGAVGAITAFTSFSALKNGIFDAERINSALEVQGKITGQNVTQLKAWGAAVESAGGSAQAFSSMFDSFFKQASSAGLPLPSADVVMQRIHDQIQGLTKNEQSRRLGLLGITDPGMIALLEQSNQEFTKSIAEAKEHARVTEEDTKAAREFDRQWRQTSQSFGSVFSRIGTDILPIFTLGLKGLDGFGKALREDVHFSELLFSALAIGSVAAATGLAKVAFGGTVMAGSLNAATAAAGRLSVALGFVAAGWEIGSGISDIITGKRNSAIGKSVSGVGESIVDWWSGPVKKYNNQSSGGKTPLGIRNNNPGNLRQWGHNPISGGFARFATPEDGLVAMEKNLQKYGERGWDTLSQVASHWAPSNENNTEAYIDSLVRNTGFSRNQRLDFSDASVRQKVRDAIIRQENGYNPYSVAPGSVASIPSNFSGGARQVSLSIGNVNVHTQATDAKGISQEIGSAIRNEMRYAVANLDDGQKA